MYAFEPVLYNYKHAQLIYYYKTINVDEYISQTIAPVSELPAALPTSYAPTVIDDNNIECCACCGRIPYEPQYFYCGCMYCQHCQPSGTCQIHNVPFGSTIIVDPTYTIAHSALLVECPFADLGCLENLKMSDVEVHLKVCKHSIVRCPYCGTPGTRRGFDAHFYVCQLLPCSCKLCGLYIQIAEIGAHVEERHPRCDHCQERIVVDGPEHQPTYCLVAGCHDQVAPCALQRHLYDPLRGFQHIYSLYDREKIALRALAEAEQAERELDEQIQNELDLHGTLTGLKDQMREMTLQRDRLELLGDAATTVDKVANVLATSEKVQVVFAAISRIRQIQGEQECFVVPQLITATLDKDCLRFIVNLGSVYDLQRASELHGYIYTQNVLTELQEYSPKQKALMSFAVFLRHYIISQQELFSEIEIATNKLFIQLLDYIDNNTRAEHSNPGRFCETVYYLCAIIFDPFVSGRKTDPKILKEILKFYLGECENELDVLTKVPPLSCEIDIDELAAGLDLPIVKYTLSDGGSRYFTGQSSRKALQKVNRKLLDYYDYVFCEPEAPTSALANRVFLRAALWAIGGFAPRVLISECTSDGFKELIPPHTTQLCFDRALGLSSVEGLLETISRCKSARELIIQSGQQCDCEITARGLVQVVNSLSDLVSFRVINQRFAGEAASELQMLQCQQLRSLQIQAEICNPSQLFIKLQSLCSLRLSLSCLAARRRLYEADSFLVFQNLQAPFLTELELDFNGQFAITSRAVLELCGCLQRHPKLQALSLMNMALTGPALSEFADRFVANGIQRLDLSGNYLGGYIIPILHKLPSEMEYLGLNKTGCKDYYLKLFKCKLPVVEELGIGNGDFEIEVKRAFGK